MYNSCIDWIIILVKESYHCCFQAQPELLHVPLASHVDGKQRQRVETKKTHYLKNLKASMMELDARVTASDWHRQIQRPDATVQDCKLHLTWDKTTEAYCKPNLSSRRRQKQITKMRLAQLHHIWVVCCLRKGSMPMTMSHWILLTIPTFSTATSRMAVLGIWAWWAHVFHGREKKKLRCFPCGQIEKNPIGLCR